MKISVKQANDLMHKFNINDEIIPLEYFHYGLNVEAEHSKTVGRRPDTIAKIVIDHLKEFPNYYIELRKMENKLKKMKVGEINIFNE